MNTTLVSDLSDATELCKETNLHLKPIAKLNITVILPKLKIAGQTISNWEVMEKIRSMCAPHQFNSLRVSKSTMEMVRFEGEVENKLMISKFISLLDSNHIKLSGFPTLLKVSCCECKASFPTRHDWDAFFSNAKNFDENLPGERPDTVHFTAVPCKFFADKHTHEISEEKVKITFLGFGELRNVDIPILDPYRSEDVSSSTKSFSFGSRLNFEVYVQYKEYIGFVRCMDAFKGKKLVLKESEENGVAASIKVDFDRTKHLSTKSISRRLAEKQKIQKLEQQREELKRREKEEIQRKLDEQRKKEEKAIRLQEERRQKREEKRRRKKRELKEQEQAAKLAARIAMEERKLLLAQRKLESIRLLSELLDRVKVDEQRKEAELKERELAIKIEAEKQKQMEEERLRKEKEQEMLYQKELEMKSRLLKRKLEVEYQRDEKRRKQAIENLSHGKQIASSIVVQKHSSQKDF